MPHILIVEDDTDINNSTAEYLRRKGCLCSQAFSGTEGRLLWQAGGVDLLLVDLMLPGLSGSELISEIRRSSRTPVIVLSARAELSDKVELLGLGADDYLTKPYQLEELWARIQVQLRHASAAPAEELLRCRDWVLNLEEMTLTAAGQPVDLTAHEFKIVELLAGRPKRVFTKQQIYEAVWQEADGDSDAAVTNVVSQIRKKLNPEDPTHGCIRTVVNSGYKFVA